MKPNKSTSQQPNDYNTQMVIIFKTTNYKYLSYKFLKLQIFKLQVLKTTSIKTQVS